MFASTPPAVDGSNHKIIIIDWDDTILPSTFVDRWQIETFRDFPLHFQNILNELGRCAEAFLAEASKHGEVIIITNSDEGWVPFSAERYVPYLVKVMEQYRVVSARTRYERFYPGQPLCWKAAAFAHEVNEIYEALKEENSCASAAGTDVSFTSDDSNDHDADTDGMDTDTNSASYHKCKRDIISFGDSSEERMAVRIVADQLKSKPKSVMFLNAPTPRELIGQMSMLTNNMEYVCNNPNTLDLEISHEQAERSAASYFKHAVPTYAASNNAVSEVAASSGGAVNATRRAVMHPTAAGAIPASS